MSYSCRVYHNSGFNAGNRPDSATLLNGVSYTDLPVLDILQDENLSEIKVRAEWSTIKDCDFCMVGSWYYEIIGITMTSQDVCHLSLVPDYILSAGGVSSLTFLDGITERVHVPLSSDTFGAYDEDDPLMAPSQQLEYTNPEIIDFHTQQGGNDEIIIESIVDVPATGTGTLGITYTTQSGEEVTVPMISPLAVGHITGHTYGGARGSACFLITPEVMNGISRLRSLGSETAIVASYKLPYTMFTTSNISADGFIGNLNSKTLIESISANFELHSGIKNNRLQYGEYQPYVILSAGGNSGTFRAEDIYSSGETSPQLMCVTDPRSDGCPYFRFKIFKGVDGSSNLNNFWLNAIAGAPWQSQPLDYVAKSGNELDRINFSAVTSLRNASGTQNAISSFVDAIKNIGTMIVGAGEFKGAVSAYNSATTKSDRRYYGNKINSASGMFMSGFGGSIGSIFDNLSNSIQYERSADVENLQYATGQVSAPTLMFPYNTNIMRDALGNGCIVYRYKYSSSDVARIDKLLTMYGYKHTKSLESSDFTNRSKFNFVQAKGVTVGGSRPAWWNDGIAAELASGIRFWHVLPSTSVYTDGTNV